MLLASANLKYLIIGYLQYTHTRLQTLKRSLSYHNNYATAWRCGADLDGPVKLAVNTSIAETVLGKLNTFFKCPKRREGTISHRIQTNDS